jgi:hypothetical protein
MVREMSNDKIVTGEFQRSSTGLVKRIIRDLIVPL